MTNLRSASAINLRSVLKDCRTDLIETFLEELEPEDIDFINHDWSLWARDDQLPPVADGDETEGNDDWTSWLILGGRGAGKTRAGAEWVRAMALGLAPFTNTPYERIALVAETLSDARSVMVEGVSGLLNIHPDSQQPHYEPSKRMLTWPNGSIAQLFSAEDPESLRGPQFHAAWCDELAKWRYPNETWDMLQFALRLGERPKQVITTTPKPIPLLHQIMEDESTYISRSKTDANADNLAPSFLKAVVKRYRDTRLGRQELDGEILTDRPDALWQRDVIEVSRVKVAPEMQRIIIAVDPPVTSTNKADACGIIIAGMGVDDRVYILEDATLERAKPLSWARGVVNMYYKYEADRLIVEVNQGGDMVDTIIRQVDKTVPVSAVRATRGKWLRAEPVAALYEQGRVCHVGAMKKLEDQMCDFGRDGLSSGRSPDRLDAMVWAVTELALKDVSEPRVRRV